jgi:hypothetical protein
MFHHDVPKSSLTLSGSPPIGQPKGKSKTPNPPTGAQPEQSTKQQQLEAHEHHDNPASARGHHDHEREQLEIKHDVPEPEHQREDASKHPTPLPTISVTRGKKPLERIGKFPVGPRLSPKAKLEAEHKKAQVAKELAEHKKNAKELAEEAAEVSNLDMPAIRLKYENLNQHQLLHNNVITWRAGVTKADHDSKIQQGDVSK